jgi:hypothetical protein
VPQRSAGGNQALIDGCRGRVGNAFFKGQLSLQRNGVLKQLMGPPVAIEVGAPRGKVAGAQPVLQFAAMLCEKAVLRRLALFTFQHRDHNEHRHHPVRNLWLATGTCSRTLTFSSLAQRHRPFDQRRQTRARLGTLTHPWDLHRTSVSTVIA